MKYVVLCTQGYIVCDVQNGDMLTQYTIAEPFWNDEL